MTAMLSCTGCARCAAGLGAYRHAGADGRAAALLHGAALFRARLPLHHSKALTRVLMRVQGTGLRPSLMRASVRDLLLRGSFVGEDADSAGGDSSTDAAPPAGMLSMGACFLEGPQEDAALYLRGRYAEHVRSAAAAPPSRSVANSN